MAWTRYTESFPAKNLEIKIMFMAFLVCFDRKHNKERQWLDNMGHIMRSNFEGQLKFYL